MKKLLFGTLALFLTTLPTPTPIARAAQNYPDPCNHISSGFTRYASPLCSGLIEHWPFEEGSDSPRFGSFMTALLERDTKNVANIAEIRNLDGSNSLDLESTDQSWLWQFGGIPTGASTIAVWFKTESLPASAGQKMTILSANTANAPGPELYVEKTSTSAKVCYTNYEEETNTQVTVCSADNSVANATHYHVAAGESPHHIGKSRLFLSLNAATLLTTSTAYHTRGGIGILDVGAHRSAYNNATFSQHFDGQLDQLLFYARPLTSAEITLLYGPSGNGRSYPFSTD
jgi:hypothetical protein